MGLRQPPKAKVCGLHVVLCGAGEVTLCIDLAVRGWTISEIAVRLGRSRDSVASKLAKLKQEGLVGS
jgi:hypothetical protein